MRMKEITVTISDRVFSIDVGIHDGDLIEVIFDALAGYVRQGFSVNVRQTYMKSPSDSLKIITKIISKPKQMDQWKEETKKLIRVLQRPA